MGGKMAYGVDDRTLAVEELAFLARMRDGARQWGDQLKYYEGYRFYKNMIQIDARYFVNTDRRNLGH